jgi:hypothetical protein
MLEKRPLIGSELGAQARRVGLVVAIAEDLIGRAILFSDTRDDLVCTVTAMMTSDDGLPFIEVSARTFSGLTVRGILLKRGGEAELLTTATEPEYRNIHGTYLVVGKKES